MTDPLMSEAQSVLTEDERLFRIHAICKYLRHRPDKPCELCPATFIDPTYGECMRGCFAMAQEVYNIVTYGNPWGERATEAGIKKFRGRFNVD